MKKTVSPTDVSVESTSADRQLMSALLVSTLVHVVLILLLSLIVLGSGANDWQSTLLMVSQPSERLIAETASFEILPEYLQATDEIPQLNVSMLRSLEIELPRKLESLLASSRDSRAESSVAAEAITVSVPVSKAALSIQKRVSEAGGRKGEVQFALAWKNSNDVDLHVVTPSGERISHLYRRSSCRGMLDVDMNVRGESNEPVENVRWILQAPWGRYTVIVNLFRVHRSRGANNRAYRGSEFQLLAQLGDESVIKKETVTLTDQIAVYRFQYVPVSNTVQQRERLLGELARLQENEEATARPLLDRAATTRSPQLRDRLLNNIIIQYPHTDTAIEAMQLLGGNITKR